MTPIAPNKQGLKLRLFAGAPCGWPSPAADYEEAPLSLDELVGITACSTYLMRVKGESMIGAGIHDGDILVVDRSLTAKPGKVVIAMLDSEFTVKRLERRHGQYYLKPENPVMAPISLADGQDLEIWGVATWCLHKLG